MRPEASFQHYSKMATSLIRSVFRTLLALLMFFAIGESLTCDSASAGVHKLGKNECFYVRPLTTSESMHTANKQWAESQCQNLTENSIKWQLPNTSYVENLETGGQLIRILSKTVSGLIAFWTSDTSPSPEHPGDIYCIYISFFGIAFDLNYGDCHLGFGTSLNSEVHNVYLVCEQILVKTYCYTCEQIQGSAKTCLGAGICDTSECQNRTGTKCVINHEQGIFMQHKECNGTEIQNDCGRFNSNEPCTRHCYCDINATCTVSATSSTLIENTTKAPTVPSTKPPTSQSDRTSEKATKPPTESSADPKAMQTSSGIAAIRINMCALGIVTVSVVALSNSV